MHAFFNLQEAEIQEEKLQLLRKRQHIVECGKTYSWKVAKIISSFQILYLCRALIMDFKQLVFIGLSYIITTLQ